MKKILLFWLIILPVRTLAQETAIEGVGMPAGKHAYGFGTLSHTFGGSGIQPFFNARVHRTGEERRAWFGAGPSLSLARGITLRPGIYWVSKELHERGAGFGFAWSIDSHRFITEGFFGRFRVPGHEVKWYTTIEPAAALWKPSENWALGISCEHSSNHSESETIAGPEVRKYFKIGSQRAFVGAEYLFPDNGFRFISGIDIHYHHD